MQIDIPQAMIDKLLSAEHELADLKRVSKRSGVDPWFISCTTVKINNKIEESKVEICEFVKKEANKQGRVQCA